MNKGKVIFGSKINIARSVDKTPHIYVLDKFNNVVKSKADKNKIRYVNNFLSIHYGFVNYYS